MEHTIEIGGIKHVNVLSTMDKDINHITIFVHHALTPEDQRMLVDYLETIAVTAVKLFGSRL